MKNIHRRLFIHFKRVCRPDRNTELPIKTDGSVVHKPPSVNAWFRERCREIEWQSSFEIPHFPRSALMGNSCRVLVEIFTFSCACADATSLISAQKGNRKVYAYPSAYCCSLKIGLYSYADALCLASFCGKEARQERGGRSYRERVKPRNKDGGSRTGETTVGRTIAWLDELES